MRAEPSVIQQLSTGPVLISWQNASAAAVIAFSVSAAVHPADGTAVATTSRNTYRTSIQVSSIAGALMFYRPAAGERFGSGFQRDGGGVRASLGAAIPAGRLCRRLCGAIGGGPLHRPAGRQRRPRQPYPADRQCVLRRGAFSNLAIGCFLNTDQLLYRGEEMSLVLEEPGQVCLRTRHSSWPGPWQTHKCHHARSAACLSQLVFYLQELRRALFAGYDNGGALAKVCGISAALPALYFS